MNDVFMSECNESEAANSDGSQWELPPSNQTAPHWNLSNAVWEHTKERGRERENEGPARNGTTTIKEKRKRKSGVRLSAKWQPLVLLGCVGIFWQIEKNIKTAAKDGEIEGKGKRDGCCCSNRIETKQQQQQQHTATLHCYVNHPPLLILTHSLSPSLSIDISSVFFFHLHRATLTTEYMDLIEEKEEEVRTICAGNRALDRRQWAIGIGNRQVVATKSW